jgi:hypothetical protein
MHGHHYLPREIPARFLLPSTHAPLSLSLQVRVLNPQGSSSSSTVFIASAAYQEGSNVSDLR